MTKETDTELLKQIVRGERPISELASRGIEFTRLQSTYYVTNPRKVQITVSSLDLAHGLLNRRYSDLCEWASFILATPTLYNLNLEEDPKGEMLLEAIWDLASGATLSPQVLDLAVQLVTKERN